MKRRVYHLLSLALGCGLLASAPVSVSAQSNIVFNGSFEQVGDGWVWSELGVYYNQVAADGLIHVSVQGRLSQDLQTVPGRDYVLTMAVGRLYGPQPFWDGVPIVSLTNFGSAGFIWDYRYVYVHAQSSVTELRFEGVGGIMDDVRVYWVQDPIRVVAQPESRSAYEGGTVSFLAKGDGTPPLRYQWFFNNAPIAGATNSSFTANQLRLSHTGNYRAVVSNSWHSITTEVAQLQVIVPPTSPEIVVQPNGDLCPAGYGLNLQVAAVGQAPLSYQWFRDGSPVPDATNATLAFGAVDSSNAGSYTVTVSNSLGSVLSLPAILEVTNVPGGSIVYFDTATNNAAAYDVDGVTRLNSNYLAQIYAGASPGILRPVSSAIRFINGTGAGYIRGVTRQIPDVVPGQDVYIQIRAWESALGASYEQARAAGGKYGFSPATPTRVAPFGTLIRTQPFSLRVGQPFFVAGVLGIGEAEPGQPLQFTLMGEVGARYLIEKRQIPNNWVPFLILTNTTGTTIWSDPSQTNSPTQIYRARILD